MAAARAKITPAQRKKAAAKSKATKKAKAKRKEVTRPKPQRPKAKRKPPQRPITVERHDYITRTLEQIANNHDVFESCVSRCLKIVDDALQD